MNEFEKDVGVDKPGIVGARWWHKTLVEDDARVKRRQVLVGMVMAGGAVAAFSLFGCCLTGIANEAASSFGDAPEATTLASRRALEMQRQYGWDFGARGVALVFDGVAEGPFERKNLEQLAALMAPIPSHRCSKYHVPTLVESLLASPVATLPDPQDGQPRPDGAPFKRLADVLLPIMTPAMGAAYRAGEAVARLVGTREDVALLADLPGPEAVAFAAGAATDFEPVLLLDNWPHPQAVVPSHLALAALAYYQPRFAAQKYARRSAMPVFVLDRARLSAYTEASDRFDNRYYARPPVLASLAQDGVRQLFYVVASRDALPEPADLNEALSAGPRLGSSDPVVEVRALPLDAFWPEAGRPETFLYGGSIAAEAAFAKDYAPGSAAPHDPTVLAPAPRDYRFVSRTALAGGPPPNFGMVPVVATASGIVLAGALNRQGSMNRFAGGWSG